MDKTLKASDKKPFWKERSNLFVVNIVLVYVAYKIFYAVVHTGNGTAKPGWAPVIDSIGGFYATITSWILNAIGQNTIHRGIDIVYMNNGKTIMVQEHCLALPAMVVFAGSILFFTGSWKNKLWFIPLGLLFVVVINTVRLVLVCLTFQYASLLVYHLHHSFIYVILTYALILLMIYWWMSKFADVPVRKNN